MRMSSQPRAEADVRTRRRLVLSIAALVLLLSPWLWFRTLSWLFPFPWDHLERPSAVVVQDRAGEPLRFFLPADERWRFPIRLSDLPSDLPRALVASEDRWFWRHPGVNPLAIVRAVWSNVAGAARWCPAPRPSPCRSRAWPSRGRARSRAKLREASAPCSSSGAHSKTRAAGAVSEPHSLRRQRRGDRRRLLVLLRQDARPAVPRRDRTADRAAALAATIRPDPPSDGRPRGARPGARPARGARRVPARGDRRGHAPAGAARAPPAAVRRPPLLRSWWSAAGRRRDAAAHHARLRRIQCRRRGAGAAAHRASCATRGSATRPWW